MFVSYQPTNMIIMLAGCGARFRCGMIDKPLGHLDHFMGTHHINFRFRVITFVITLLSRLILATPVTITVATTIVV